MHSYINKKGFALVMTLGIMTMLSVLAIGFLSYIRIESKILINTYYKIAANYAAESGIEQAIAHLKAHALNRSYYSNSSSLFSGTNSYDARNIVALYDVAVIDCASQIYINNNFSELKSILKGLPSVDSSKANDIVNNMPYQTKQEIMKASSIGATTYENIKNYITVNSWLNKYVKDTSGNTYSNGRPPINLNSALSINSYGNTASDNTVVSAVLSPMFSNTAETNSFIDTYLKATDQVTCPTCNNTGKTLDTTHHPTWYDKTLSGSCPGICCGDGAGNDGIGLPFKSWAEFNAAVDAAVLDGVISTAQAAQKIKDNVNPNPTKTNTATTEFCFNSNGYFDITSKGTIETANGVELASSSLNAVYHIFEVKHYTLKEQFEASGWDNFKVTTQDFCPTLSNESWTEKIAVSGSPTATTYVNDSVKLGYWEDFTDISDAISNWYGRLGTPTANTSPPETLELIQDDSSTYTDLVGPNAVYSSPTSDYRGNYSFSPADEINKWTWGEFFAHVWIYDVTPPWKEFPEKPTYTPPYTWPNDSGGYADWTTYTTDHKNPTSARNLWEVGKVMFGVNPKNTYEYDDAAAVIRMKYEVNIPSTHPTNEFYLFPAIELNFPNGPASLSGVSKNFDPAYDSTAPYILTEDNGGTTKGRGKAYTFALCKTYTFSGSNAIQIGLILDSGEYHHSGTYTGNYPTFNGLTYTNYQPGLLSIQGTSTAIRVDNVRIIPRTPYYIYDCNSSIYDTILTYARLESASIPKDMTDAEASATIEGWGTITGTVTLPATSNEDSEFVFFRTNKNSLTSGNSTSINIAPSDGVINGSNAISRLQFHACFESNHVIYSSATIDTCDYAKLSGNTTISNQNFQETPILEDVTVIYLPHEEITYWKKQ